MADPCDGIKSLLVTASVGASGGSNDWAIYIGRMPDQPDNCICIYPSSGGAPNPKWLLDYPGIQVIVRGDEGNYDAARQKAQDVKDVLTGLPSQTITSDRWVGIWMVGDIQPVNWDPKKRWMFSLNFRLIIEPASNSLTHRSAL